MFSSLILHFRWDRVLVCETVCLWRFDHCCRYRYSGKWGVCDVWVCGSAALLVVGGSDACVLFTEDLYLPQGQLLHKASVGSQGWQALVHVVIGQLGADSRVNNDGFCTEKNSQGKQFCNLCWVFYTLMGTEFSFTETRSVAWCSKIPPPPLLMRLVRKTFPEESNPSSPRGQQKTHTKNKSLRPSMMHHYTMFGCKRFRTSSHFLRTWAHTMT